jgi:EpsI family protein
MFWIGSRWREAPAQARAVAAAPIVREPGTSSATWVVAAAVLAVTAAWPLASIVTRQDDALHPVNLGAIAIPGWSSESTSGLERPDPIFKAPSATRDETLRRADAAVRLYIAYYRGQSFERKLVSSENVLVPSTGSDWHRFAVGKRRIMIDGAPHDVVVTHLLGPRGQELYAWQWYWINGSLTASDVVAKARLIWLRLTGRGDDAASIIIYAATREGQDPSSVLQSFTHDAWPAIAAALVSAGVSR